MNTVPTSILIAALTLCISLTSARAEPGDYSAFQTLRNLISPRVANNPVTPAQAADVWPLLSNPTGFDDGFRPGSYLQWQTIQLHPDTGAVCGNGSPYKFFVNRAPNTSNMLVYMEGGGACWDYESCTGGTLLSARNPNGIPDDYLSLQNASTSLVSPFVFRLHPYSRTKTQQWTMVYVPYCTGDTYAGDSVQLYENPDPAGEDLVWHHNGLRNVRAVIAWLKDNLERPVQMLSTGCSAGGAGSLSNYAHLRRDMAPDHGFLLNDSGPLFPAGPEGSGLPNLSYPLHTLVRARWGLDEDTMEGISPMQWLASQLPDFDSTNLGSLYQGLSGRYADDRLGHTHFWQDYNYSRYSYESFYPEIYAAETPALAEERTRALWYSDTKSLAMELALLDNFGVYLPNFRALNASHCSTIVDFRNGDIQEAGLELQDFIDNLLDGSGPVINAVEREWSADPAKPVPLLYRVVDKILSDAMSSTP